MWLFCGRHCRKIALLVESRTHIHFTLILSFVGVFLTWKHCWPTDWLIGSRNPRFCVCVRVWLVSQNHTRWFIRSLTDIWIFPFSLSMSISFIYLSRCVHMSYFEPNFLFVDCNFMLSSSNKRGFGWKSYIILFMIWIGKKNTSILCTFYAKLYW